jgi:tetratricopeptide (TPR) repeat protein
VEPLYLKAEKAGARDPEIFKTLGQHFLHLNQDKKAADYYLKALTLEPNAVLFFNLGLVYRRLKQNPEAAKAFSDSAHLDPKLARAWKMLGLTLLDLDRHQEAAEALEKAVALEPDPKVSFNIGLAYRGSEEYEKAARAYEEAIRLDPKYIKALVNLGYARIALKQYDKASETFHKALALKPDYKNAKEGLAEAIRAKADKTP